MVMPKFKLKHAIIYKGKRYEVDDEVEMTKKQAEAYGPGVAEEVKEPKQQNKAETKKPEEKK